MIRLKDGVSLDAVHPQVFYALSVAAPIWARHGARVLWVTAANEAGHTTNPDPRRQFHRLPDGSGQAADLRTWTLPEAARKIACEELAAALGPDFYVAFERPGQPGEHCHVQYKG